MDPRVVQPAASTSAPVAELGAVELQGFSYQERRVILPRLNDAMTACGCWLLERKAISLTQLQFRFEMQLRSALELYSGLLASGIELTRGGHLALNHLCTLYRHKVEPGGANRILTLKLDVSFLDETEAQMLLGSGAGAA